ncbi:MAG: 4'-phosphopantetheinyl transferase superfamily protein [Burkholderiales bacterium]|nr:4'-phosphopantetheinyl transferase superfamily protein [Anaerolineae bacterium]
MVVTLWQQPVSRLTLSNGELHIWYADLDVSPEVLERLEQTLAEDEYKRAVQFVHLQSKRRYVAARGILRNILAQYIQQAPEAIQFVYNAYGKPSVSPNRQQLEFNLAHSVNVGVYAFTIGQRVGIDVEFVQALDEQEQMAQKILSQEEYIVFSQLPPDEKVMFFYQHWTRKEAMMKALGVDFSDLKLPVDKLNTLQLIELKVTPGYSGALATEHLPDEIRFLKWTST